MQSLLPRELKHARTASGCEEISQNSPNDAGFAANDSIGIADAHRGDGRRFVVHADEKLSVFLELESAPKYPGFNDDGVAENSAPVGEGYD